MADTKVLVVDDQKTMRRIICNLLGQIGFASVEDAEDGTGALAKLRDKPGFGLIISDWNMEPMSGLEFLKEVRKDPSLKQIPFIMVTAESKMENVVTAKKEGVDNYIVKPFSAETLKNKINVVMK